MITDILFYVIPALLMILVTQLARHVFSKRYSEKHAICNGARWLLILLALVPIVNMIALILECAVLMSSYTVGEIQLKSDDNKFLRWWRK